MASSRRRPQNRFYTEEELEKYRELTNAFAMLFGEKSRCVQTVIQAMETWANRATKAQVVNARRRSEERIRGGDGSNFLAAIPKSDTERRHYR